MSPELSVPTQNEKDYCHFCFGAIDLVLVFPHVRPDLKSFIDNVIGIQLTPDAQETFTLCGECIGTMDMFTAFRSKCRSHFDKVCEVKIMNQAVKKMFPLLQQHITTDQASLSSTMLLNVLNESISNGDPSYPAADLTEDITSPTNGQNNTANGYVRRASKRVYGQSPSPDIGADSATKKLCTQSETSNRKTKFHHIRKLVTRCQQNRLQNIDAVHRSSMSSSIGRVCRRIEFKKNLPLANGRITSGNNTPPCKPCVVVVHKCLLPQTVGESCKS
ncbi:uncharacterized protein LOC126558823 [Anopheles maculipalpis]|uniref:uncharacterized protein LOC126558823 n=1 Tax=Anopheles maculipalpis TaxID=1496333 RepID=UPI002159212A|nr:uncharacterized protein LOC126558823 [Anopheles maculipalpis]